MILNMLGMRLVLVAAVLISVTAIKVPVEKTDDSQTETKDDTVEKSNPKPIYYESDEGKVDSYLVPPNPHRPAEVISEEIATPATYLLPPSVDKQSDYYKPTESGEQTDWYPIAPVVPPLSRGLLPPREAEEIPIITVANLSDPIFGSFRTGKVLANDRIVPVPSRSLQPPPENAQSEYVAIELEEPINFPQPARYPLIYGNGPIISVPNNIRQNPIAYVPYKKYKNPTKLYPKKYGTTFKPVPIPLVQFADEPVIGIPKAKPLKPFKPYENIEAEYRPSSDDKKKYKLEEPQPNRKLKGEPETQEAEEPEMSDSNEEGPPPEQETSATNYRIPSHTRFTSITPHGNVYSAPLRQAPPPHTAHRQVLPPPPANRPPPPASRPPPLANDAQSHKPPADGERTEFRMHGMKGPHSYQFGFDTGKGKNRQFRYEERDNDGHVKGHYGYVDKHGKLRVVNYDADPEHGFRAEAPVETE